MKVTCAHARMRAHAHAKFKPVLTLPSLPNPRASSPFGFRQGSGSLPTRKGKAVVDGHLIDCRFRDVVAVNMRADRQANDRVRSAGDNQINARACR